MLSFVAIAAGIGEVGNRMISKALLAIACGLRLSLSPSRANLAYRFGDFKTG
jgi:hypothetical protein